MSKSKNNGVDPQATHRPLRRRHRAPVHDVREPARADAGMVGRRRRRRASASCAGCGPSRRRSAGRFAAARAAIDLALAARRAQGPAPRDPQGAPAGRLRLPAAAVQHRGVGGHEDAQRARGAPKLPEGPQSTAVLREGLSILIRVLYPVVPHIAHALWTGLGYAGRHGDLLDAPWPPGRRGARWCSDEIELVLQINGKVRGAVRVAADADATAIEAAAAAPPRPSVASRRAAAAEEGDRGAGPPGQPRRLTGTRMASDDTRRSRRGLLAAAASTLLLAGCGFQMRGAAAPPFKTLYIGFPPGSTSAAEFKRLLRGSSTVIVDAAAGGGSATRRAPGAAGEGDRRVLRRRAAARVPAAPAADVQAHERAGRGTDPGRPS